MINVAEKESLSFGKRLRDVQIVNQYIAKSILVAFATQTISLVWKGVARFGKVGSGMVR